MNIENPIAKNIEAIEQAFPQMEEDDKLVLKISGNKIIVDRCFHEIKRTGSLGKDAQFLENRFQSVDIEDIQNTCLKIRDKRKKYLGGLQLLKPAYIGEFEQRHKEVCYYLAGLKHWGQE